MERQKQGCGEKERSDEDVTRYVWIHDKARKLRLNRSDATAFHRRGRRKSHQRGDSARATAVLIALDRRQFDPGPSPFRYVDNENSG